MNGWRSRVLAAVVAVFAMLGLSWAAAQSASATTIVVPGQPYRITLEMSECGVMYVGTTGTCIVSLQTWLNMSSDSHLVVDGSYGPKTLAAVQAWQRIYAHDILPDGHFGVHSRHDLAVWYWNASAGGTKPPCILATAQNCDVGAVDPGLGEVGIAKTIACAVLGKILEGADAFCDVVTS